MAEFSKSVEAWADKARAAALELFKQAFIEAGERLIDRTPIRTGRARGSWASSINGPDLGEVPQRSPDEAKAELHAIAAGLKLGDIANMTSVLSYIRDLEYGKSDQAPHGMLRLTAQDWQIIVAEAVAKVKAKRG